MKETLIDLKNRRSCRSFEEKQVTDAELDAVLEAGLYAASAKHDTVMVAVRDKKTRDLLSQLNARVIKETKGVDSPDPFYGAPAVIVVLTKKDSTCAVEDGSSCLANMINAAHAVGLGSCWIHRGQQEFECDEGRQLLKEWGLSDYKGIGHCILGYARQANPEPPQKDRKRIIKLD